MENRLLEQFNTTIKKEWFSSSFDEPKEAVNYRELFELAYHTANTIGSRNITMKLSQDPETPGHYAVLYNSKNKIFIELGTTDEGIRVSVFVNEGDPVAKATEIQEKLKMRKSSYGQKEKEIKTQLLKTMLVERKLDECANFVMLKDIARKVYFAIGDARESAAVVPMFMEAEGASLVQLALNKWMAAAQRLPPEENFPDSHVPGILKNLMQIKKWVLNLVSTNLDK